MPEIGTKEIILLVVVIVLLFGAKQIPELTKSIVESIRHLRGAFKDEDKMAIATEVKKK